MNNLRAIYFVLLAILLASGVSAIGITPGGTTIDFEAGATKEIDFTIINSEGQNMEIIILVQGELNQSVSLSEVSFVMRPEEKEKKVRATITLPARLEPGTREAEIVVIQLPTKSETSGAFVGAAVGVTKKIRVNVPYPGKYAEADFSVIGPDSSGEVHFVLPVISRGEMDLARVRADIEIYNSFGEVVDRVSTAQIEVPSGQRKELAVKWSADVTAGNYRAVATLVYDEETRKLEKQFAVGQRRLELKEVRVNDFSLGEIAKFEIMVENSWGELIRDAFAEMSIYGANGQAIAELKSPNYDLPPLENKLMTIFWDTAGIKKGVYDSSIVLNFGEYSEQHELELEVSDSSINVIGAGYVISADSSGGSGMSSGLVTILVTAIVVLLLVNLLWFIYFRKKFSEKTKKRN